MPSEIATLPCIGAVKAGERVVIQIDTAGNPTVIGTVGSGDRTEAAVQDASAAASEAQSLAESVSAHTWTDAQGTHVTSFEQADSSTANGYETVVSASGSAAGSIINRVVNGVRKMLQSATQSGTAFYDGEGNSQENIVALFSGNGVVLGKANESNLSFDYHSMQAIDKDGNTYMHVSDFRKRNDGWQAEVSELFIGDGRSNLFAPNFEVSEVIQDGVTVDGVIVGFTTTASMRFYMLDSTPPTGSEIVVRYKTINSDAKAYTLGKRKQGSVVGVLSFAEGSDNDASGWYSHVEGLNNIARGRCSHAEGNETVSSGEYSSHSEGYTTVAGGAYSHAEGYGTKTYVSTQHVAGKYNFVEPGHGSIFDRSTYARITGNGTSDSARSNAEALDWDGNLRLAGTVYVGCNADSSGGTSVRDAASITEGTLPINRGGTGATTAGTAVNALFNDTTEAQAQPFYDTDMLMTNAHNSGATSETTWRKRRLSELWTWVKGHADSTYMPAGAVIVQGVQASSTTSINANSMSANITFPIDKDGYTPLGIVGVLPGNNQVANVIVATAYINSSGAAQIRIYNPTSTARTVQPTANVLYVKN